MKSSNSVLLAIATFAVSTAAVFIVLSGMDPAAIAAWRLGTNAIVFVPFALPGVRREIAALSGAEKAGLMVGGVTFGLHFVFFNTGFRMTSYESTVILLAAQPLFAAMLGRTFLGERVMAGVWLSMAVSTFGLVILVWNDYRFSVQHLLGDLVVLGAGLSIVLTYTFGRKLRQKLSVPVYVVSVYSIAAATALVYLAVSGQDLLLMADGAQGWVALVILLALPTVIGHTLFNHLVKYVKIVYLNIVILAEPVIAMLLKYGLRGRFEEFRESSLTLMQAAGTAVLFAGLAVGMWTRHRENLRAVGRPSGGQGA